MEALWTKALQRVLMLCLAVIEGPKDKIKELSSHSVSYGDPAPNSFFVKNGQMGYC
jgi:hypothetical protein